MLNLTLGERVLSVNNELKESLKIIANRIPANHTGVENSPFFWFWKPSFEAADTKINESNSGR